MNVKELLDRYVAAKDKECMAEYINDGSTRQREIDSARREQAQIIETLADARNAALEEAATLAERHRNYALAVSIRALKTEQAIL